MPGPDPRSLSAAIEVEEFWLFLGVGGAVLLVALVALLVAQSAFRRARTALTEARLARQEARELSVRQSSGERIPAPNTSGPPALLTRPAPEGRHPLAPVPQETHTSPEPRASEPRTPGRSEAAEPALPHPPPHPTDLSTRRLQGSPRPGEAHLEPAEADSRARLKVELRDPDPLVRIAALEGLAGDSAAQPDLIAALGDDFPHVRREAVRALRSLEGIEVVRAIIDVIDHDPAAEVREEALEVLVHSIKRHGAVHRGSSAD